VIEQAAGLALLAALSPTALLVAAVYLGSARPRLTAATGWPSTDEPATRAGRAPDPHLPTPCLTRFG
jgi:hypothetical protein